MATTMSFFSSVFHNLWTRILDNKGKLTASGGFILGIILTLGFKDFYPDLEYSFRQRIRRLDDQSRTQLLPGQTDYVRLEDHTLGKAPQGAQKGQIRTQGDGNEIIREGVEGLIGDTPLIKLRALSEATGCEILAKAEFLNGAGNSPKDRVALSIITHAEEEGLLEPGRGDTIYEGTVGSTGISLAAVCRARGYKAHMYVTSIFHRLPTAPLSLMML